MDKIVPKIMPGFMELLPEDQILFNKIYDTIKETYEKFGFLPLDTPVLEYSNVLLAKAGGETEKQIYRFKKGDNDISLRFDLTVPLARYVSQNYNNLLFPFKRYQMGKVYRGERPQRGRYREFYQCDIDIIGEDLDLIYDAEMPSVIYEIFRKLDFGKFTIRMNNRKILNGFFEYLNLNDKIADILRIVDKIDKIGEDGVKLELQKIEISDDDISKIFKFIGIKGKSFEVLSELERLDIDNDLFKRGLFEIREVVDNINVFGLDEDYFIIDLTIARGLDYYTGTVYETILDEYPSLGSICSGGRYDNLTEYYTDKNLNGIGISIGLTRLFFQLKDAGIIKSSEKTLSKVLIIPFNKDNINYAIKVSKVLRDSDINCDVYYENKNLKQKMKYANRIGVPFICVLGEDEEKQGKVTLKNMVTGDQVLVDINQIVDRIKKETSF